MYPTHSPNQNHPDYGQSPLPSFPSDSQWSCKANSSLLFLDMRHLGISVIHLNTWGLKFSGIPISLSAHHSFISSALWIHFLHCENALVGCQFVMKDNPEDVPRTGCLIVGEDVTSCCCVSLNGVGSVRERGHWSEHCRSYLCMLSLGLRIGPKGEREGKQERERQRGEKEKVYFLLKHVHIIWLFVKDKSIQKTNRIVNGYDALPMQL